MKPQSKYSEKLRDPRWQKKRLEIMQRDEFTCQSCYDSESTLNVHHMWYERGKDPWDYSDKCFVTLCEECHAVESQDRQEQEQLLLLACREQRFFADNLNNIACAIGCLKASKPPDVVSHVIAWAIQHRIETIIDMYFANLSDARRKREAKNGVD